MKLKIFKNKKAFAFLFPGWYWIIPAVVPLWIFMFGTVKATFFTDWDAIFNKVIILSIIIAVAMIIIKKK